MQRRSVVFLFVFALLIMGISVYWLQTRPLKDSIIIDKTTPVEVKKPTTEAQKDDGTWHEGTHEAHAPPGAATTPDFPPIDPNEDPVEAAYKRLEYIKNNPYAWGGVHSERATELIAELLPPPVLRDHAHAEEVSLLIDELIAQGDPRAADVLITNICEGYIAGHSMFDGLVEIGPPAVSYVLPYLSEDNVWAGTTAKILARIAKRYPSDLGGIVNHILIPKLEVIVADEKFERFGSGTVIDAEAALSMLQ